MPHGCGCLAPPEPKGVRHRRIGTTFLSPPRRAEPSLVTDQMTSGVSMSVWTSPGGEAVMDLIDLFDVGLSSVGAMCVGGGVER